MGEGTNQKRCAFLFPGQGAQYPGMGRDFYELFSTAKQTFHEADDILRMTFSKIIFKSDASELTLTKNSQIAIFIVSTAIFRTIKEQFPLLEPFVCAGLSLGEYTALIAAEKMSFAEGLELVRIRATAMQEACVLNQGTMQVVLGLSEEKVAEVVQNFPDKLWIANLNCPGQVVIAGDRQIIESAATILKEKGAKRILSLDVSGAFHSGFMQHAQDKLSSKISEIELRESPIELVMNVPGDFVTRLDDIRYNLIKQIVSTVRWEQGIRMMMKKSVDMYLGIGPGKTLSGMNKQIGVKGVTLNIEKIEDLEHISKGLETYATAQS